MRMEGRSIVHATEVVDTAKVGTFAIVTDIEISIVMTINSYLGESLPAHY